VKHENPKQLEGNLTDKRFLSIVNATMRRSQLRITVDINNYLGRDITCIKPNRVMHEICSETDFEIGRALVIKVTVEAKQDIVKINAEEDYSEEFLTEFFTRYKEFCQYRRTKEEFAFQKVATYTTWMVFNERQLFSLDNQISIPEVGIRIKVGRHVDTVKGTWEFLKDELVPPLIPGNDKRASGFVINGVDPQHRFDRMFYRVGKEIFEVDLDRDPNQTPGVYIGVWNRLNQLDDSVRQDIVHISLEDAASGKNPSGIQMYPSILEAILGKPEHPKEEKVKEEKKESVWEEKDQKAKVSHTWVKVAADFLKNVLPAAVTIVKGIFSLIGKFKKLPV